MKALFQIHRVALLAYPPSFRRHFGAELQRTFEARATAARPSRVRVLLLFLFHCADAIASGLLERGRLAAMRWAWPREYASLVASSRRSLFMTRESLVADLKLALRQFTRTPVFATLTVLTLALGIGANTAIFGVAYAVLLRPLPYTDPGRLVMIWDDNTRNNEPNNVVSPSNFFAIKREATSLSEVSYLYSFLTPVQFQPQAGVDPQLIQAITIAPDLLRLLGRPPLLGRVFNDVETDPTVVLSHSFWKRTFGADVDVIGRMVTAPGAPAPLRIVGVMPEDFVFPYRSMLGPSGFTRALSADVWLPHNPATDGRFQDQAGQPVRAVHFLSVIGRLKPGKTIADTRAELSALASRRAAEFPDTNKGYGATVKTLHEQTVGKVRPALIVLLLGVGVVMLITCVNVANVLLARATGQQRDLAIRSALGASRRRLVQQTLVESTTLAFAGGLVGIAMMVLGTRLLIALAPPDLPRLSEATPGAAAALFAVALSLLTGLIVGSIPAWSASRSRANETMRDGTRTTTSASRQRVRSGLIVAEVAMAMALTLGAGLLLRSFVAVMRVNPGFASESLLTFQMNVPGSVGPAMPARLAYYDDLEARLRAIPGVVNVGGTTRMPLGSTNVTTTVAVDGRSNLPAEMPEVEMRRSIFDFVGTMKIPVLRGRTFTNDDGPGAPPTVLINDAFAKRVFPGDDPIGKHVALGGAPAAGQSWLTIVGVIGSVRHGSLEENPKPEIYLQYRNNTPVAPFIAVRTIGDPVAVGAQVREAVKATGANAPFNLQTMEQLRSESMSERRFVLALIGTFGVLALTLAAVGVYGVITLIVAERRAEVGIRLALGATPMDVGRLMVRQAVGLAGLGVAAGGLIGLAFSPWFGSVLYGVAAIDPVTYVTVGATLVAVAAAAAFVPARRAMKVDPAVALRG